MKIFDELPKPEPTESFRSTSSITNDETDAAVMRDHV